MNVPPEALNDAAHAISEEHKAIDGNPRERWSRDLALIALHAAAPLIAAAAWRDGYAQGRDDEACNAPLAEYQPIGES